MRLNETQKLDVMEMKCLQSMCGKTRMDRWKNEEFRCNFGVKKRETLDRKVLK